MSYKILDRSLPGPSQVSSSTYGVVILDNVCHSTSSVWLSTHSPASVIFASALNVVSAVTDWRMVAAFQAYVKQLPLRACKNNVWEDASVAA